jgi:hypothetical protein
MAAMSRFLSFGAWQVGSTVFEVASRRRLDARTVVPSFERDGITHVGLLERARAARKVRGAPLVGYEPIGIDFSGVDETGDILDYGKAIFTARSGVRIDPAGLKIPLPSYARSIGYLSELALPLIVRVEPPDSDRIEVAWDGETHHVVFAPLAEWEEKLSFRSATPRSEDVALFISALSPRSGKAESWESPAARAFLGRESRRMWNASDIADCLLRPHDEGAFSRLPDPQPTDLRFLSLREVEHGGKTWEIVKPKSGVSVAVVPYVWQGDHAYFLLWCEIRPAALERRARQPIFDLPMHPRYLNATASFLAEDAVFSFGADASEPTRVLDEVLGRAFGQSIAPLSSTPLGQGEPAPGVSSEVRARWACALDPSTLGALPDDAVIVRDDELCRAVSAGFVRDPVIVMALCELGLDPFVEARRGDPTKRLAFLDTMTQGSIVARRLKTYSSIEAEQLEAPTYARLMILLQHEYGVRIAYPKDEKDRSFFKAAFRVFMAADREEHRALQGLHWSHDAFHFALGNFTLPGMDDLAAWYASGDAPPAELPPEGPLWERYSTALKAAEDEATFFSFYTLFAEKPSLVRHVGKLTYWQAVRDLGVEDRCAARNLFDALTTQAVLPEWVKTSAAYVEREEIRSLFDYMLGFRDYHLKDIKIAFRHATRDPYRGIFLRHRLYEHDLETYLSGVRGFQRRLERQPPGLNPLLSAVADARVAHALRVWDVAKALRLVRAGSLERGAPEEQRRVRTAFFSTAEKHLSALDGLLSRLDSIRARVVHAEIVPSNEVIFADVNDVHRDLGLVHDALWDDVAATGLLADAVLAEERARELPRLWMNEAERQVHPRLGDLRLPRHAVAVEVLERTVHDEQGPRAEIHVETERPILPVTDRETPRRPEREGGDHGIFPQLLLLVRVHSHRVHPIPIQIDQDAVEGMPGEQRDALSRRGEARWKRRGLVATAGVRVRRTVPGDEPRFQHLLSHDADRSLLEGKLVHERAEQLARLAVRKPLLPDEQTRALIQLVDRRAGVRLVGGGHHVARVYHAT